MEKDLDLLKDVHYLHQRSKLAIFLCNSKATYLARSLQLALSEPRLHKFDQAFNALMARTLSFEPNYGTGPHRAIYQAALTQLRLSIKEGGFVTIRNFDQWLAGTAFVLP